MFYSCYYLSLKATGTVYFTFTAFPFSVPEFPGGINKLLQFINDNMKYPTKAQTEGMQGKVIVQFIIDEDGYIIEPNIVRSVESSLDNEALRLIKMLPQWKPGTLKGKLKQ